MNELSIFPIISCRKSDANLQDIWLIKQNGALLHLIKRHKLTHILISGKTAGYGRASK